MYSKELRGLQEAYLAVYDVDLREELVDQTELTLQIIENAAYILFSQGYNADDVISYFTEARTDVIVEDFVNFAEGSVILESVVVSEEYIEEQYRQLDEKLGGALNFLAKQAGRAKQALGGIKKALTPAAKAPVKNYQSPLSTKLGKAPTATPAAKPGLLQRAATGAKEFIKNKVPGGKLAAKIAKGPVGKLAGRAAPGVGAALYGMDAVDRAKKGDWGGAALSGLGAGLSLAPGVGTLASLAPAGVQMATDAMGLTGDKSRKGIKPKPAADKSKYNASAALGGKTAFQAGGGAAAMKKNPKLTAADIQRQGTAALRSSGGGDLGKGAKLFKAKQEIMSGKPSTPAKPPTPQPSSSKPSGSGGRSPSPASSVKPPAAKPSATKPPAGTPPVSKPTKIQQDVEDLKRMQSSSMMRQQNRNLPSGKIPTGDDLKPSTPAPTTKPTPTATSTSKSTSTNRSTGSKKPGSIVSGLDMFDLVKGYLLDEGYADTEESAIKIMANMSEEWRESILDEAQHARENPEKYESDQKKKTSSKAMPPRGDKRREDFEKWYAKNVR